MSEVLELHVTTGEQVRWRVLVTGAVRQPPLVFLHGFLGSGEDWLSLTKARFGGYRCIMPDLPGCGPFPEHGRSEGETLSFESVGAELSKCLHQLECFGAPIIAYSLGGRLALAATGQFPDISRLLVLEGSNPGITGEDARRLRLADDERLCALLQNGSLTEFLRYWYTELPLFASLRERKDLLEGLISDRAGKNQPAWAAKVLRELSPVRMGDLREAARELQAPVLLLSGALDEKYSASNLELLSHFPHAEAKVITGAGHNTHVEQPDAYADAVLEFLARCGYGPLRDADVG